MRHYKRNIERRTIIAISFQHSKKRFENLLE